MSGLGETPPMSAPPRASNTDQGYDAAQDAFLLLIQDIGFVADAPTVADEIARIERMGPMAYAAWYHDNTGLSDEELPPDYLQAFGEEMLDLLTASARP